MREMKFKMEQEGVLSAGQKVEITEGELPSSYYYTVEPALAMSANYSTRERLKSREGTVKSVEETPRGFYTIVEFDE